MFLFGRALTGVLSCGHQIFELLIGIRDDGSCIPEVGELHRPWAMKIGFIDVEQRALNQVGIVIGVIQLRRDV